MTSSNQVSKIKTRHETLISRVAMTSSNQVSKIKTRHETLISRVAMTSSNQVATITKRYETLNVLQVYDAMTSSEKGCNNNNEVQNLSVSKYQ